MGSCLYNGYIKVSSWPNKNCWEVTFSGGGGGGFKVLVVYVIVNKSMKEKPFYYSYFLTCSLIAFITIYQSTTRNTLALPRTSATGPKKERPMEVWAMLITLSATSNEQ